MLRAKYEWAKPKLVKLTNHIKGGAIELVEFTPPTPGNPTYHAPTGS